MPGKRYIFGLIMPIVVLLAVSCDDNTSSSKLPFEITVTDTDGFPIVGAVIEGGLDWDSFRVITDYRGRAIMPGIARNVRATIKKNNHFSLIENYLKPGTYVLELTPRVLTEIGDIEGDLIRFDFSRILTITYQAEYRVYGFNGYDLSEIVMAELPHQVKEFRLLGHRLWYTTHRDGIYVYSLADNMNPVENFHLDIEGYLRAFAVKDSLVAVGPGSAPGPIRLFSYHTDGTVTELDRIENFTVSEMYFRSHYLITTGYYSDLCCIFDITNPADIRFVYRGHWDGYSSLFLRADTLVLKARGGNASRGEHGYLMVDLSDPANPTEIGEFVANGEIEFMVDDFTAIGRYYFDPHAMTVFERNGSSDFDVAAIVSEFYGYPYHYGANPPYYLFGRKLWNLENR